MRRRKRQWTGWRCEEVSNGPGWLAGREKAGSAGRGGGCCFPRGMGCSGKTGRDVDAEEPRGRWEVGSGYTRPAWVGSGGERTVSATYGGRFAARDWSWGEAGCWSLRIPHRARPIDDADGRAGKNCARFLAGLDAGRLCCAALRVIAVPACCCAVADADVMRRLIDVRFNGCCWLEGRGRELMADGGNALPRPEGASDARRDLVLRTIVDLGGRVLRQ
jgi:hypothetical protein